MAMNKAKANPFSCFLKVRLTQNNLFKLKIEWGKVFRFHRIVSLGLGKVLDPVQLTAIMISGVNDRT